LLEGANVVTDVEIVCRLHAGEEKIGHMQVGCPKRGEIVNQKDPRKGLGGFILRR
jgi:hypothetical protein